MKEQEGTKSVTANVYGYNAKNARVAVLPVSDYKLEVVKVGTSTGIKSDIAGNVIPVVYNTVDDDDNPVPTKSVTGTAVSFVDLASYVVTAKSENDTNATGRKTGVPIGTVTFRVEDSSKLEVRREKASVSATNFGTVKAAVKEAFKVQLNDSDINWDHVNIEYTLGGAKRTDNGSTAVSNGNSIYVTKIFFEKTYDSGASVITYTFNVNMSLTISK